MPTSKLYVVMYHHPGLEPSFVRACSSMRAAERAIAGLQRKNMGAVYSIYCANVAALPIKTFQPLETSDVR